MTVQNRILQNPLRNPWCGGIFGENAEIGALAEEILSTALEVHRFLGPGVLEYPYQVFMKRELENRGIQTDSKVPVRIEYEGEIVESGLELDLLVEERVVVEIKCVPEITALHRQEVYTYLRLARKPAGLIISFHSECLHTLAVEAFPNQQPTVSSRPSSTGTRETCAPSACSLSAKNP